MPIYDALYDYREKLQHILVRHEQGGIHAGQGYARTSGKVGVVFATSGPGATNLVTGLADAQIDSTPLVCITGQVFAHLLGTDAFQETDVINITTPVTKWNYQVTDAKEIPSVLAKAFYIARSGRPGPVLIDITKNAQLQLIDYQGYTPCNHIRSYRPAPNIRMEYIRQAADLINSAKKPFVLFGQGVLLGKAELEFKAFIEKAGIPAAWTIMGVGAIPTDHPLDVGMLGMHGNYGPNVQTNSCDVLIAIGMRFDDRVTGRLDKYARQAKIIHLDIDPAEIDKNVKADVPVWGDCKATLPLLTELVEERTHDEWLAEFREFDRKEHETVIQDELNPVSGELTMGEVINKLNELTKGEAIIVSDVGQHQMVACRYAKFNNTRSNVTSGGLGTMGFALPAAIGAKFGAQDRTVVAVIGDGGFQMTLHATNDRYPNDDKVAQVLAQLWTRVGIQTKVEAQPGNIFFARASNREYSVIMGGAAAETGEASSVLRPLLATFNPEKGDGSGNRGRYSNPEFDRLLAEALRTVDDRKREALLRQATELAIKDNGVIPIFFLANSWASRPGFNYRPRTDGWTLAINATR